MRMIDVRDPSSPVFDPLRASGWFMGRWFRGEWYWPPSCDSHQRIVNLRCGGQWHQVTVSIPQHCCHRCGGYSYEEDRDMSLKKALAAARASDLPELPPVPDSGAMAGCPTLWEMMTVCRVDGKPRQTSTLSVWVQDGKVTACLNERDTGMALFASGATLDDALEEMELHLLSDSPPWRKQRGKGRK